jgi:hypothetical protein
MKDVFSPLSPLSPLPPNPLSAVGYVYFFSLMGDTTRHDSCFDLLSLFSLCSPSLSRFFFFALLSLLLMSFTYIPLLCSQSHFLRVQTSLFFLSHTYVHIVTRIVIGTSTQPPFLAYLLYIPAFLASLLPSFNSYHYSTYLSLCSPLSLSLSHFGPCCSFFYLYIFPIITRHLCADLDLNL